MLRPHVPRRATLAAFRLMRRRLLTTATLDGKNAISAPRRRRSWSKWRTVAVVSASAALLLGLSSSPRQDTTERPLRHQWLFLRSSWLLSSAFVAHTEFQRDLLGGSSEIEDEARAQRRIRWWDAIQHARQREEENPAAAADAGLQEKMMWMLVDLLLPSESENEAADANPARETLVKVLVERDVLGLLTEYVAMAKPTDPALLGKILQCMKLAFDVSAHAHENATDASLPSLSLVGLGVTLGHLIEQGMPRYGDLVRLGESLLQFERLGADTTVAREGKPFTMPRVIDNELRLAVNGYLQLLSPGMPPMMKQFAMDALAKLVRAATQLPACATTRQLDALLSPTCATYLLALPRTNEQLQQSAAALLTSLIQVAQAASVPVHDDVYNLWIQQVRSWAKDSSRPGLQLACASCLRVLSSHPRTRHFVRDSPGSMEALFVLARQLHEEQVRPPSRPKGGKKMSSREAIKVPSLYDQLERVLTQKHLSKAFLNVCTSYKSGGTAILETMSSQSSTFHSKRTLPMSRAFRGAQDLMDLPVIGAEEYDASTEFGWADILTQWTGSTDREIRHNAIESLAHLVEQDSETPMGLQKQQHLLQAWLASMLQHVRNITGGEEILAIKQVEDIASISDEFTPGNEKVLFNPAVVDAGASALAILAEQHYDELIHYGVVQLMSLLAMKCPSDGRFEFSTQSARVIANLVAACSNNLEEQQHRSDWNITSTADVPKTSIPPPSFGNNHPLWKTFFAEVFDVGQMLETSSSGQKMIQTLQAWRDRDDPYQRSQLYRALTNMAAYRELSGSGKRTLPVYAEGVHPIVPQATIDDMAPLDESDIDVVFVHGLRGDAFGTWRTDMSDAIDARTDVWPDILLYDDLKNLGIPARVISLGYEAGMVSWSSPWPSLTLQERAKIMLKALKSANVGGSRDPGHTSRPVIFVTHSMGGILVKKMLLLSKSSDDDQDPQVNALPSLAETTKGVVFLAVPHFGSDLARGARSEAVRSLLRTHPAIQDLCASHDRRLESLNDSFAELNIDCISIAEQKPAPLGFGISAMVVKPDSANPGFGQFFVLPGTDHMTICKAKSHDDPMYRSVLEYVLDHVNSGSNLH